MENDLTDVGLEALEALEAQDEQDNSEPEDTGEDVKDTTEEENTTEDDGDTSEEDNETSEDDTTDEADGDTEDEPEDKGEDKKAELSDEEFEEMARKRGYSKAEPKDETTNNNQNVMDKLLVRPKEIEEEVWGELPVENKIVYNALPYIEAVGKDGNVLKVKTPDQLPDDFDFASKKDEAKFYNELQAQEMKATQMFNAINARNERIKSDEAQKAEARNVITQIEALQKNGTLPTPKAKYGTKEFDNDPAVLLVNKVLNFRAEKAREIGANLTIADSLMLYKAVHPEEFVKKEAKGDIERANVAKKVAGNSKSSGTAVNKDDDKNKPQYYRVGMSTEDVLDRVLDDME